MMNKEFKLNKVDHFVWANLINADAAEKAESLVNFKVLEVQLAGLLKSLPLDEFETAHPGVDFWTCPVWDGEGDCPDSSINALLSGVTDNIPEVIEIRDNAITVKNAINALPYGQDAWNALSDTDRCFIIIEAHKSVPGIVLDKSLFRNEKGVDLSGFTTAVKDAYNSGMSPATRKALINAIRSMFFKVCGNAGDLFTGLSLTRSEIAKADLMHFCAAFGGRAKRSEKKDKDGNKVIGRYDYQLKAGSWKVQSAAITTLLGVILESRTSDYCKVVRG